LPQSGHFNTSRRSRSTFYQRVPKEKDGDGAAAQARPHCFAGWFFQAAIPPGFSIKRPGAFALQDY